MAIRFPVRFDLNSSGVDFQEISSSERDNNITKLAQIYMKNAPLTSNSTMSSANNAGVGVGDYLLYAASGDFTLSGSGHTYNILGFTGYPEDTFLIAGGSTSHKTSFRTAAQTQDVSTTTVDYDRLSMARNTAVGSSAPSFPADHLPLYWTGTELRQMTVNDVDDTFIKPAILRMTGDTDPDYIRFPFTPYTMSTSESVTDYALMKDENNNRVVFQDHRANVGAYTANRIPEARQQLSSINKYFLHRYNGPTLGVTPLATYNSGLQEMPETFFTTHMVNRMAYYTRHVNDFRIGYHWNDVYPNMISAGGVVESQNMGTLLLNTKYTGSTYQRRKVNTDDYRTQEFPAFGSGENASTAPTDSSFRLKITRY